MVFMVLMGKGFVLFPFLWELHPKALLLFKQMKAFGSPRWPFHALPEPTKQGVEPIYS